MRKLALILFAGTILYAADADNGKKLYATIGCYECHGRVGQGEGRKPDRSWRRVRFRCRRWLRMCGIHRGPCHPATSKLVTRTEQLGDIHEFLTTIPAPAKDIPLLK